jgi:hypothetical protein
MRASIKNLLHLVYLRLIGSMFIIVQPTSSVKNIPGLLRALQVTTQRTDCYDEVASDFITFKELVSFYLY